MIMRANPEPKIGEVKLWLVAVKFSVQLTRETAAFPYHSVRHPQACGSVA